MGSRYENSNKKEKEADEDNGEIMTAVAAVAGVAALAAWGISKLFGSTDPEPKLQEKTMMTASASSSSRADHLFSNVTSYSDASCASIGPYRFKKPCDPVETKWTKPKMGWIKLNTDASQLLKPGHKTGPSLAGGVLRDHTGKWIVGFTATLGVCDSTAAELKGIREGLRFAWDRDYQSVEIETDSEAALILIDKVDLKNGHYLLSVVQDCKELMGRDWDVKIIHVGRGGNYCANAMAKNNRNQIEQFKRWNEPPFYVQDLVLAEMD